MIAHRRARSLKIDSLEALDERVTPSGGMQIAPPAPPHNMYSPSGTSFDKMGQTLGIIYEEYLTYQKDGANGSFVSSQSSRVFFGGTNNSTVGVDIKVGANFALVLSELKGIGMQVNASSASLGIIEGYLPISKLATVANDGNVVNITPVFRPSTNIPLLPPTIHPPSTLGPHL